MEENQTIKSLQKRIKELEIKLKKLEKLKWYWLRREDKEEKNLNKGLPFFKEDKNLQINNNSELNHMIIEWDNFYSLSALQYTHKWKIDLIYIDPPYNTGNKDFIYNDNFIDKEDTYKHSKRLSFMFKRLKLARNLLSDNWIIFISIDDNEQANLKLLCDEIFWEENFISLFTRNSSSWEKTSIFNINTNQDYILLYCNNLNIAKKHQVIKWIEKDFSEYKNPDNAPKWPRKKDSLLIKIDAWRYWYARYWIKNPYTNETYYPPVYYDEKDRKQRHYVEETFNKFLQEWKVVFEKKEKKNWYGFYIKKYLFEAKKDTSNINSLMFISNEYLNTKGTSEIKKIFKNKDIFTYSKPSELIKSLIKMFSYNKTATILDFFAWSWTTWHAVLELNEDWGNRQFILCSNRENTKENPDKNICKDITYERNKRILLWYEDNNWTKQKWLWWWNLRYYNVDFIEQEENTSDLKEEFINRCDELLCIKENIFDIDEENSNNEIRIFTRNEKTLIIVYNIRETENLRNILDSNENQIYLYIFSSCSEWFEELFAEYWERLKVQTIPDEILKIYKKIFKF